MRRWHEQHPSLQFHAAPSGLKTQLLILQSTPFCNINCSYCYLPERDNREIMPLDTIGAAIDRLVQDDLIGEKLTVIWHAGEPLTVRPQYYDDAFALIEDKIGAMCGLKHSFQTNGLLIDDRWCRLFKDHDVDVGLSIDGPADMHDSKRRTRTDKGTYAKAIKAVNLLNNSNIDYTTIAVVSADTLKSPRRFIEHFRDLGTRELGINFDEAEGTNTRSSLQGLHKEHKQFLAEIFNLIKNNPEDNWPQIREFNSAYRALITGFPSTAVGDINLPENNLNIPLRIISIDRKGNFSTFSPELLGQPSDDFSDFVYGNVHYKSYLESFDNPAFIRVFNSILSGLSMCETTCEYYQYCGGGAPANKYYENGTFASSETLYCQTMIKNPFDILLGSLEDALLTEKNCGA